MSEDPQLQDGRWQESQSPYTPADRLTPESLAADLSPELKATLGAIAVDIRHAAQQSQHDCLSLLALLRLLEALHREIRDDLFQEALPTSRHSLYALLRDIEAEGGWPYIHRMKLQALLANFWEPLDGPGSDNAADAPVSPSARPNAADRLPNGDEFVGGDEK